MGPRVLVVDAHPESRVAASAVLQDAGYRVLEASDGVTALELLHTGLPDVVIMEILLPGLHGYELIRQIRKHPGMSGAGVLVLSEEGDASVRRRVEELGCDAFMLKPCAPDQLVRSVAAVLSRRHALATAPAPALPPESTNHGTFPGDLAIFSFTSDGLIASWNAGAARTFGYGTAEALGRPLLELLPSAAAESLPAIVSEVRMRPAGTACEKLLTNRAGQSVAVSLSLSSASEADLRVIGIASTSPDFPEIPTGRDAIVGSGLRRVQRRGRAASLVYQVDRAGRIEQASVAARRLVEVRRERLATLHALAFVAEDYRAMVKAFYREQLRSRTPTTYLEFPIVAAGGRHVWLGQIVHLVTEGSRVKGLRAIADDVTQYRTAEESLRMIAEVSRSLGNSRGRAADARMLAKLLAPRLADLAAVHLAADDLHATAEFGCWRKLSERSIQSTNLRTLLHLDPGVLPALVRPGEPLVREVASPLASRDPWMPELGPLHAHGVANILLCAISIGEEVVGVLLLGRSADRGPFSRADVELGSELANVTGLAIEKSRLFERAQRSVADRDQMVAFVAHELRNPLSAIRLGTAGLLRHGKLAESAPERKQLLSMQRAAENMRRLIQDLLDAAKMESGNFEIQGKPIPASCLLDSVIRELVPLVLRREFTVSASWSGDGPQIRVDTTMLVRTFSNLVTNAVKFTRPDGRISVRAEEVAGGIRFEVDDDGIGIPLAQLPHVFDRYWQGERADQRGTGLGLSIARGIVEAHGGTMSIASRLGEGTTVSFTIPTESASDEEIEHGECTVGGGGVLPQERAEKRGVTIRGRRCNES
jgi:PAS domain S-box-containing protein